MKRPAACLRRCLLLACLALAARVPAHAQTLQSVVQAHVQAMGGEEALRRLKTVQMEGTIRQYLVLSAAFESVIVQGEGVSRSLSWNGVRYRIVATAQGGHRMEGDGKRKPLDPREVAGELDAADLAGPFVDTEKKGISLQWLGEKTLKGGIKTHVVEASRREREPVRYFIRSDNHLLARMETRSFHTDKARWQGQSIDYEDHRPVAGVQMPFRIRLGDEYTVTVKAYKVNEAVDPAAFQ